METQEAANLDRAALLQKARRRQEIRVAVIGPVLFVASVIAILLTIRLQHPAAHLRPGGVVLMLSISAVPLLASAVPLLAMVGMLVLIRRGRLAWLQPARQR